MAQCKNSVNVATMHWGSFSFCNFSFPMVYAPVISLDRPAEAQDTDMLFTISSRGKQQPTVKEQWKALSLPFHKDLTKSNKGRSLSGYQRLDLIFQTFHRRLSQAGSKQRDQGDKKAWTRNIPLKPQSGFIKSQSLINKNRIWRTDEFLSYDTVRIGNFREDTAF